MLQLCAVHMFIQTQKLRPEPIVPFFVWDQTRCRLLVRFPSMIGTEIEVLGRQSM